MTKVEHFKKSILHSTDDFKNLTAFIAGIKAKIVALVEVIGLK